MYVKLKNGKKVFIPHEKLGKGKNKKALGATLLSGGLGIANTLIQHKIQKDRLEDQKDLMKKSQTNAIVRTGQRRNEEDIDYFNNNPELIYGVDREIQAFGRKGDPTRKELKSHRKDLAGGVGFFKASDLNEDDENDLRVAQYLTTLLSKRDKTGNAKKDAKKIFKEHYGRDMTNVDEKALLSKNTISPIDAIGNLINKYTPYESKKFANTYDENTYKHPSNLHKKVIGDVPSRDLLNPNKAMGKKGMVPLSSNASVVNAGTHESGNDLDVGNMTVEDDEVVTKTGDVFSDRMGLITPAEHAESLSLVKGVLEKLSKNLHGAEKGNVSRAIASIDNEMNITIDEQEEAKDIAGLGDDGRKKALGYDGDDMFEKLQDPYYKESGIPLANYSDAINANQPIQLEGVSVTGKKPDILRIGDTHNPGKNDTISSKTHTPVATSKGSNNWLDKAKDFVGDNKQAIGFGLDFGVSILDNVLNAKLLNETPKVPVPIYDRPARLKTSVNVEPQLSNIRENRDAMEEIIDESTLSSNSAIQRKRAALTDATKNINEVMANKENIETDLENKAALNVQQVEHLNNLKTDRYRTGQYQRDVGLISAKSHNIANASRDASDILNKIRMADFQNDQLLNDAMKYDDIGTFVKAALNGSYDNAPKKSKQRLLNSLKDTRPSDYETLRQRWSL